MDRPNTPGSGPPGYHLPSYDDHDDSTPTGQSNNPAAIRLLTSVEEDPFDSRQYVPSSYNNSDSFPSSPQSLHKASASVSALALTASDPTLYPKPLAVKKEGSPAVTTPDYLEGLKRQEEGRDLPSVQRPVYGPRPLTPQRGDKKVASPLCLNPTTIPTTAATPTSTSTTTTSLDQRKTNSKKLGRSPTVKLQRKSKKKRQPNSDKFAEIRDSLPTIPEGPSPRKSDLQNPLQPPIISPSQTDDDTVHVNPEKKNNNGPSSHTHLDRDRPNPSPRRSYQPSIMSDYSRHSGITDPPSMPPPDSTYVPFQGRDGGSPTRPWSRMSNDYSNLSGSYLSNDYSGRMSPEHGRPPPGGHYEPSDLNGSPRPGTPSSRYGGSPRRPLPPAPLFSNPGARNSNATFVDDASVSIPLDNDPDNVFGPESDLGTRGPMRHSYQSQETLNDGEDDEYDEHNEKVQHYGPAPDGKQERRGVRAPQMSRKEVQLINGELVLECKIPTILYSFLPRRDEIEFTHMRYTAVTCDPDDFVDRGYKLRQTIGRTARETELFICVTMYNENEIDFTRTMHAVMKNISHFCSRSKSRTWGENGWQKIVVCIVSDGREKINPRTLDALAAMGVYQDGIAKNFVNQKAVQAHVYEYTTQVSLDSDLKFKGAEKGIVPCQIIFCLKEKNQRKLNSHRWFFNAFGKALNPNVCILLDVGTRPGGNSLYHLWKAFDNDSNVAGACGEIKAMKGRFGANLLNPLVASQNFEYKMSNILDKPLESVFGYITVLPGALSAYRYHALQNDETGHGPLSQYFKGETLHGQHADVFTANMYLAEDRILCWELVAKRGDRWVLKYVKGCTGETDVPDTVAEFISQRRRWLNGAFFAAVYSLVHFKQIWSTDHTIWRKILLHLEFFYQFLQLIFTFFSLANFYLTFYFVAGGLADPKVDPFGHNIGSYIFTVLRYTCALLIGAQFIISLGNRPQGANKLYLTSMIIFVIIMIYTAFATVWIVVFQLTHDDEEVAMGNNVFTNLIVSIMSTFGLYIVMSLMYLEPWHLITSLAQYYMLLPFSICTLQVYAFCNTHDVTWGTKGDNVMKTDLGGAIGKQGSSTVELEIPSEQLDIDSGYDEALRNLRDRLEIVESPPSEAQMQEDYYRSVRTYLVTSWMITNGILAMAVSEAYSQTGIGENYYLRFILWSVASLALFRALGSTTFAIINVINMAVEGRMRMQLKRPSWLGGGKIPGSTISASNLGSTTSSGWSSDLSSKVTDKLSSVGSAISSKFKR